MPTPARCASLLLLLAVAASCIAFAAGAALHVSARGQAPPARNASTLRKNPHLGTTNTIVLAGRHVELLALLPNQRRVWQSPAIGPEGVYVWMAAVLPGGDVVAMVLPENNADEDADLRLAAERGDMSSIVRLDGSSGEVVWRWAPPKGNMVISTPLIRGPNMYLALCTDPLKGKVSSALEAHSLADASRVWSLDLGTLENDAWGMMRAGPIADGETNIQFGVLRSAWPKSTKFTSKFR